MLELGHFHLQSESICVNCMPCCLTVIFCDLPKKKCRFLRYGKLMFPIADDSQFLGPVDCVFSKSAWIKLLLTTTHST